LGVEAKDVLFVAGSAGDVEGATNAGMKVVWHNKIGLTKRGNATPLREGRTLDDALKGFL
jgi:FMN phosphatase YigB (HAD superfamily)